LAAQLTDESGQVELEDIYNSNYNTNPSTGEVNTTYNTIVDGGRGFNEFLVNYQEVYYNFNETTGQVDTTYGANRRYNPRQNAYFKPIVTLRDVWSLSDRSSLTTTAYASFGSGGGEALLSTSGATRRDDYTMDIQGIWDAHQLFEFAPNGLNVDENGEQGLKLHSNFTQ
jgi:hypothetical protein